MAHNADIASTSPSRFLVLGIKSALISSQVMAIILGLGLGYFVLSRFGDPGGFALFFGAIYFYNFIHIPLVLWGSFATQDVKKNLPNALSTPVRHIHAAIVLTVPAVIMAFIVSTSPRGGIQSDNSGWLPAWLLEAVVALIAVINYFVCMKALRDPLLQKKATAEKNNGISR